MAGWVYGPSVPTLAAGRETGGLRRCALARTDCRGCDNIRPVSRHDVDLMSHECQLARMAEPSLQLLDRRFPEEYGEGAGRSGEIRVGHASVRTVKSGWSW